MEGFRRAQHRYIGTRRFRQARRERHRGGAFHAERDVRSTGQGNAAHTHEVEEVFFILAGKVLVFVEDEAGNRAETVLGPWDCVSCPADVLHGFQNVGLEPAYLQVMLGKGRPDLMTYKDETLQQRRGEHLAAPPRS